ncbi:DUF2971 domain-containing protein [Aeromonas veronii]|uniref:DUF2971 domain-containing protein n=1 Tax=Aeromonas veronii TaxID=654 RepID=UPI0040558D03
MNIMYKYLNFEVLESFIKSPSLKLTNPNDLNDPFESSISDDIKNAYNELSPLKSPNPIRMSIIEKAIYGMGIVSLTETHRNKLMWAHYANEHKGVVIGFNTELLSEYINKNNTSEKGSLLEPKLYKVNYDSVRFDIKSPENSILNHIDDESTIKFIMEKITTTKSDDWIYEKEHRYILSPGFCDKIKIKIDSKCTHKNAIRYHTNSVFNIEDEEALLNEIENSKDDIEKTLRFKPETKFNEKHTVINDYKRLFNITSLMSIPKECISSIHFGARVSDADICKIISEIKKQPEYININLIKYSLCNTSFSLESETLNKETYCASGEEIDSLFDI